MDVTYKRKVLPYGGEKSPYVELLAGFGKKSVNRAMLHKHEEEMGWASPWRGQSKHGLFENQRWSFNFSSRDCKWLRLIPVCGSKTLLYLE